MLNLRQQTAIKFDKNMYNFEKKRQTVDNQAKIKEKETEEKVQKNKEQSNKKIQINFQNSFVTQRTQEKYDKIIECNNKRNTDKLEKNLDKELENFPNLDNFADHDKELYNLNRKNENNIDVKIHIPKELNFIKENIPANDFNETNLTQTVVDNTMRNNESEMIFIEEMSYFKSRLNDTNITDKTFDNCAGINKAQIQTKYQLGPIIDETLQYESEEADSPDEVNKIQEDIIEEKFETGEEEETYYKFLEETNDGAQRNHLQDILRAQMKNIIHNIKDRKKELQDIKSEQRKMLLNNITEKPKEDVKNKQTLKNLILNEFIQENENKLTEKIKELSINNNTSKFHIPQAMTFGKNDMLNIVKEVKTLENNLEKDYIEDFITDETKVVQEDALDEDEVMSIHQSIRLDNNILDIQNRQPNLVSNEEEQIPHTGQNFILEEFLQENTRDEDANCEEIYNKGFLPNHHQANNLPQNYTLKTENNPYSNRVLVFQNEEDPSKMEKKKRKFEEIRENKIKEIEHRREKSKQKIVSEIEHKKSVEKLKRDKSPNYTNKTKKNSSAINTTNSILTNESRINTASDISVSNISRVPIKISREESQLANKKIKNVNFSKLSNKKTIKSAISNVCLAGEPNRVCREKILEIIEKCPCENFIILFKGNFGRYDLRAVYTFNSQNNRTELLTCLTSSPVVLESNMIGNYYKYDNTQKDFKHLNENKELSLIVDAVSFNSHK